MTFEQWMKNVDQVVGDIAFGLSVYDLPDIDFRSLYEAGEMAQTAAEEALAGADFAYSGENDHVFRAMAITSTGAKRSVTG